MTTSPKHKIRTRPSHLIRLPISGSPSRDCAVHGSVAQNLRGVVNHESDRRAPILWRSAPSALGRHGGRVRRRPVSVSIHRLHSKRGRSSVGDQAPGVGRRGRVGVVDARGTGSRRLAILGQSGKSIHGWPGSTKLRPPGEARARRSLDHRPGHSRARRLKRGDVRWKTTRGHSGPGDPVVVGDPHSGGGCRRHASDDPPGRRARDRHRHVVPCTSSVLSYWARVRTLNMLAEPDRGWAADEFRSLNAHMEMLLLRALDDAGRVPESWTDAMARTASCDLTREIGLKRPPLSRPRRCWLVFGSNLGRRVPARNSVALALRHEARSVESDPRGHQ
jgi:hypothetical protein